MDFDFGNQILRVELESEKDKDEEQENKVVRFYKRKYEELKKKR